MRLTAALAATLAAATWSPTRAAPSHEAAAVPAEATTLERLPAGRDELVFRGENAARSWVMRLTPAEAARATAFQLSLLNAVVVLPERSSLRLTVNGRVLATLPVRSPDKPASLSVRIPAGVLTPGANTIRVSVALAHRVDCSVKATYELWASLDPAKTGIVMDSGALYSVRALDELAAEPLGADGATRIHLREAADAEPEAVARAGRFISALVRRAGLTRPIVDVGPELGRGPGFDVVLSDGPAPQDASSELRVVGRDNGVTFSRDQTANRLVIQASSADDEQFDALIAALDGGAAKAQAAAKATSDVAIEAGARKTFAELGLATESFAGRHYLSSVGVTLPADFFPASTDRSRLMIDGSHSGLLDQNSELIFRVNGAIVSTMPLAAGRSEQFAHRVVELPLRFFHPGHNDIAIEGITSSLADAQCDLSAAREARLTIAGTSELQFPDFAHLRTLPQIPSALSAIVQDPAGRTHLYLPDLAPASVGTALSILANIAATTNGADNAPLVHLQPPAPGDIPGLVIGALDQLPDNLAGSLRKLVSDAPAGGEAADAGAPAAAGATPDTPKEAAAAKPALASALEFGQSLLRSHGFFFGGDDGAGKLPMPENALLIGAVAPQTEAAGLAGVALPQVTRDPAQWLVVTARNPQAYAAGVERLIANGQWSRMVGEAVSLDPDGGPLHSAQPARVAYVAPSRFVLSDVRPILGGILSDNILLGFGALILLMSLLGVSTHALIRRMGVR